MVVGRLRMSALNRKLLRDVWEMKGQALAIAAVIGAGVTMFITYLSTFDSLERTLDAYYERQRFADVFVSVKRAPQRLEARLADIRGVETVETRVVANVTLDVPGLTEPATARLVSVPAQGRPALNDLYSEEADGLMDHAQTRCSPAKPLSKRTVSTLVTGSPR